MITRQTRIHIGSGVVACGLLLALSACGESSSDSSPTATPTRQSATPPATSTATVQPTATRTPNDTARVVGLVVVNQSVSGRTNDRLGAPPIAWMEDAANMAFDKALGFADWAVLEDDAVNGTTGEDGRFEIESLGPGRYTLAVTKTLDGNLLSAQVPFTVGAGGTTVVAEVSWGLVRSVSTYTDNGVEVRDVRDPYGRRLIIRDGHIAELGDPSLTLSDPDGDGLFDITPCVDTLWSCPADRSCGSDRVCGCVSSCPFCEDCGATACQPLGLFPSPYRCSDAGTCSRPSDRCVCVSSCPECDECVFSACVPDCQSAQITAVSISGSAQLILGQTGSLSATAMLSNGRSIDVTTLVDWTSSNLDIASVDAFGTVSTHAVGTAILRAALGDVDSNDWTLTVNDRPPLRRIYVQNVNCYYPLGDPVVLPGNRPPVLEAPPIRDDIWWPSCNQVLRIGGTIQFRATGEFGNGAYYQDISDEVTWQLNPSGVGSVAAGLFTAQAEGTTNITASLSGITSDPSQIRVVTKATVVTLSIYTNQGVAVPIFADPTLPGGSAAEALPEPCFECGYTVPVLRGDHLQFHATAQYDTGDWQDVTGDVAWHSSDDAVVSIDATGDMLAIVAGTAIIDATFEEVTSNPVTARVVNEATLEYLYLQVDGPFRVVVKGGALFFHAFGSYDVGLQREVTDEATWRSSNDEVGKFLTPGVFTGRSVGSVQVWAEVGDKRTESFTLEVYETSDITYCDTNSVNRGVWADDFNRVTLESDCDTYTRPGTVTLRYTVTETQPHGGIFDPCLDLYIFQGNQKIRTLREEGCGEPFLNRGAPEFADAVLRYQLRAFWDLRDENGQLVAPGTYTVFGRFYLYYDPVVSIDVSVQ